MSETVKTTKTIIRSSKASLKFANKGKRQDLLSFLQEYRKVVVSFIDILWELDKVPSLLPKEITSQVNTWLSVRSVQCAGKQASGVVRGTRAKQQKWLFVIKQLNKKREFKKARKLQRIYDKTIVSKPSVNNFEAELDSRFVKIVLDDQNKTSFDGWLSLSSVGNKLNIQLPFKKHKHFNKMLQTGRLKAGVRLSETNCTFSFDVDVEEKTDGVLLGIDIGQTTTLSCSDGTSVDADNHGHTYTSICNRLARKKKGSKSFERTQKHRSNYIRWCLNQIDVTNIKQVNIERIKHLRRGRRTRRSLSHWNYKELFDVIEDRFSSSGVLIKKLDPTYTSQRCSKCGWVCKRSREAKKFRCVSCGFTADADLNASINLSLDLTLLQSQKHLSRVNKPNIKGFYWLETNQEPIVPDAFKA